MTEIRRPAPDVHAAGQPSPEQLAALAHDGVRTVINLRAPDEPNDFDEAAVAETLGLRYVRIPVSGPGDVTRDTVEIFSRELERAREEGDVLVHCASANRVGALLALDHGLTRGAPREAALELGRAGGLVSLEPVVDDLLRQGRRDRTTEPSP